jgi:hypothetical protein
MQAMRVSHVAKALRREVGPADLEVLKGLYNASSGFGHQ